MKCSVSCVCVWGVEVVGVHFKARVNYRNCYIHGLVYMYVIYYISYLTNLSNMDPLGIEKCFLTISLVRCPDFRGCNVHQQEVWDNQCVLFMGLLVSGCLDLGVLYFSPARGDEVFFCSFSRNFE